jgi:uncharacterized protein YneF (UPF0154 family)
MVVPAVFTEFSLVIQRQIIGDILAGLATKEGGSLSRREIARQLSKGGTKINESTLRTAFTATGSTASQKTIDRIAQAITDTQILTKRVQASGKRRTVRDFGLHPAWPDFYKPNIPEGARGFKVVVKGEAETDGEYHTLGPAVTGDLNVEDYLAVLDDAFELDMVIYDVS